jgi:acyl-CoA synthetase (AMP-forming)/AMP-acid ligase II
MNRIPEKETLLEIFQWRVKQSSDDVAFKFNDNEMTYGEYDLKANQVANGFIKGGCLPNSRIAVLAKNSVVYAEILFGSLKSRTALVGLNWRLAGGEVVFIVNDSRSEILFVGKEFYQLVDQIKHEFNHVKQIIALDYNHDDWQSYNAWQNSFDDSEPGLVGCADDDVIQLYTSGTTGLPKGVRLTNKNINRAIPMVKETWGKDWHEKSVNFILSPLFHIAGSNIVLMGVVFGCKNIVIPEPHPEKILHLIQTEKIETAFMVPALIQFILNHPDAAKTDFSSLRQIVYGASPISEDTLLRAIEVIGCEFWQVYGLTETSGIGTTLAPECHDPSSGKLRSCGKKYSGVDIKIVDQKGTEVSPGEVGEITIKSSVVMKGYWNRDEANKEMQGTSMKMVSCSYMIV